MVVHSKKEPKQPNGRVVCELATVFCCANLPTRQRRLSTIRLGATVLGAREAAAQRTASDRFVDSTAAAVAAGLAVTAAAAAASGALPLTVLKRPLLLQHFALERAHLMVRENYERQCFCNRPEQFV